MSPSQRRMGSFPHEYNLHRAAVTNRHRSLETSQLSARDGPVVPMASHCSRSLLACGGSNSAVLLEPKFLPQPMKQAQMKTTIIILGQ